MAPSLAASHGVTRTDTAVMPGDTRCGRNVDGLVRRPATLDEHHVRGMSGELSRSSALVNLAAPIKLSDPDPPTDMFALAQ
jgi:hypothetical protein